MIYQGLRLAVLLLAFCFEIGCAQSAPPPPGTGTSEAPSGAAATSVVVPSNETAPPASQTGGFDGQRAYDQTKALVAFGPRPPASDAIHKTQDYIRGQLQGFGCAVQEDDFHSATPVGDVMMKNIVAKTPGDSGRIILLLTHYDTVTHDANGQKMDNFVGAVDGGSSTGLVLEMARLLCGRRNHDSIWMAFLDGEEAFVKWSDTDSTYGSRELAARMALSGDLKHVKAVLLADMVGPRNVIMRRDTNSTPWLVDLVWNTAARLGYKDIFISATIPAVEDDHLPFVHRGIPSVDVIDLNDYSQYWHTPQDTMDKVSPRSLAIVGHVLLETVNELQKRN
jgi:glutaminyl-peptide cyclotransferase